MSSKRKSPHYLWYLILSVYAILSIFPFLWMVTSSFKPPSEVMAYPPTILPKQFIFSNYTQAWEMVNFSRNLMNSAFITCISTFSVVATSAMAAYSMVILKVRGSNFILALVLLGLIIPMQTSFIPVFLLANKLNLVDTYTGVIMPYLTTAFGVFMLNQFFKAIPMELIDAARIDGLGEIGIISRIVLPLTKPGILTLVIFTFMNVWKDFFWPFLLLNSAEKRTVPLGIVAFWQSDSPHFGMILAAATISMIPLVAIFAVFQKQFIQGISFSGLKQ